MKTEITLPLKGISNQAGFTIIEALIALAIFSIGFLSIGFTQITSIQKTTQSRKITEAMSIAETKAESLMAVNFYVDDNSIDDDQNGEIDFYDVNPDIASGNYQDNAPWTGPYQIFWNVADDVPLSAVKGLAPFPVTRTKTITLWVTPDSNSDEILIEMQFIKVGIVGC